MNDVSKTQTQLKLNKAIEHEGLKINEAAACLGIQSTYVSMIRNDKHWPNCSSVAWEAVLKWVNSGQSLREYSEKHGKVLPEIIPQKHIELPPKVIKVSPPEIKIKPEDVGIKQIKVTPENKEKVETAERLSSHPYFTGERTVNNSKICIDIEINLIINGKKISL